MRSRQVNACGRCLEKRSDAERCSRDGSDAFVRGLAVASRCRRVPGQLPRASMLWPPGKPLPSRAPGRHSPAGSGTSPVPEQTPENPGPVPAGKSMALHRQVRSKSRDLGSSLPPVRMERVEGDDLSVLSLSLAQVVTCSKTQATQRGSFGWLSRTLAL